MRKVLAVTGLAAALGSMGVVSPLTAEAVQTSWALDAMEVAHDLTGRYGTLEAVLTDAAGNPVAGAPVVFEEIEAGSEAIVGQVGVRYIGRIRVLCHAVSNPSGVARCTEDPHLWSRLQTDRVGRLGPRPNDTSILAYVDDGVYATYDIAHSPAVSEL